MKEQCDGIRCPLKVDPYIITFLKVLSCAYVSFKTKTKQKTIKQDCITVKREFPIFEILRL